MSWNYRVIKTKTEAGEDLFSVHEVYYDKKGRPHSWTATPIGLGGFEFYDDLVGALTDMLADVMKHPVLKIKNNKLVPRRKSERQEEGK